MQCKILSPRDLNTDKWINISYIVVAHRSDEYQKEIKNLFVWIKIIMLNKKIFFISGNCNYKIVVAEHDR